MAQQAREPAFVPSKSLIPMRKVQTVLGPSYSVLNRPEPCTVLVAMARDDVRSLFIKLNEFR
jgi:hypothetical protein